MTPSDFKHSLAGSKPPDGLLPALVALWWAGKDDWNKAHQIVANGEGSDCAWVHAHLHRVAGDLDNAIIGIRSPGNRRSRDGMGNHRLDADWPLSAPDRASRP